jgi:hypothetical protein
MNAYSTEQVADEAAFQSGGTAGANNSYHSKLSYSPDCIQILVRNVLGIKPEIFWT